MAKLRPEIPHYPKTEEDQQEINKLKGVRFSLVDRTHVERFVRQMTTSEIITEGQREFIKKLQHKYRGQIKCKK